ncbi:MAG TPA: biopolymer transporter ExbD [bacterium]|nr:biopolymer transporter ExbD [bacterium]
MAFGPSAARRTGEEKNVGDEYLVPIMGLMTLLIPLLLMSAVFVTTVALQVTLPPQAAASGAGAGGMGGVTKILMVGMSADKGFIITNDKGVLPAFPERSGADRNWIPKVGGSFDFATLREVLLEKVKKLPQYQDHEEVYLAIQDNIPFTDVINLMDTVRGDVNVIEVKTDEDAAKYSVEKGQKAYVATLFPSVIFGGAVPR